MKIIFPLFASIILLAGCGLTPPQLKAIGESKSSATMCFQSKTMGFETTTVVTVAGTSGGQLVVQPTCATVNGSVQK